MTNLNPQHFVNKLTNYMASIKEDITEEIKLELRAWTSPWLFNVSLYIGAAWRSRQYSVGVCLIPTDALGAVRGQ